MKDIESIAKMHNAIWHDTLDNGDTALVIQLMYHVALYINPDELGGCQDRFCVCSLELAIKAAQEYSETGEMRYWQKWHNEQLSSKSGYVYPSGGLQMPEYSLYQVDWDTEALRREYPFQRQTGSVSHDCSMMRR